MNIFIVNDLAQLAMKLKSSREKDLPDILLLAETCKAQGITFEQLKFIYNNLYNESVEYKKYTRKVKKVLK